MERKAIRTSSESLSAICNQESLNKKAEQVLLCDIEWQLADFSNDDLRLLIQPIDTEKSIPLAAHEELRKRLHKAVYVWVVAESKKQWDVPFEERNELIQEFLATKLTQALPKYKILEGSKFESWIAQVWKNFLLSHLKKRARLNNLHVNVEALDYGNIPALSPQEKPDFEPSFIKKEYLEYAYKHIQELINDLPEENQRIAKLFFIDERSRKEIGLEIGLTPNNVGVRIHRIRSSLIKRLPADVRSA